MQGFIDLLNSLLEPVRVSLSPPDLREASSDCLQSMDTHPPPSLSPSLSRACGSGSRLSGNGSLHIDAAHECPVAHTACRVSLVSGLARMLWSGSELSVSKESVYSLQLITARLPFEPGASGGPCRKAFNQGICGVHS